MHEIFGVLGGMGPLATADFLRKLTELTPAHNDQEHIPTIVYSVPQIPDRSSCIMGHGPSPLPALLEGARFLESNGAQAIAITCNTAHFWYDDLVARIDVPIIHIADAVIERLVFDNGGKEPSVGLLATAGTIRTGVYQTRLARHGLSCLLSPEEDLEMLVMPGIAAVKAGDLDKAGTLLEKAARSLMSRGATAVVMACTEIPLALADASLELQPRLIDATAALAASCVRWWREHQLPSNVIA